MSETVRIDRTSLNLDKMNFRAHRLIGIYEQKQKDPRVRGLIRLKKDYGLGFIDYLREQRIHVALHHRHPQRTVGFANTKVSALKDLLSNGQLGSVIRIYVGPFRRGIKKRGHRGKH